MVRIVFVPTEMALATSIFDGNVFRNDVSAFWTTSVRPRSAAWNNTTISSVSFITWTSYW